MPDDKKKKYPANTPQMRASTPKERIGDFFSELMGSVAEQPLVRGLSKANELLNPAPPPGFKIGMMPGEPGSASGKVLSNVIPKRSSAINPMYLPDNLLSEAELASRQAMRQNNSYLGKPLAPNVKMMHPSVPPEFHAVEKARMPQSRTAPINMNEMPSGKMEFLDPDVAEFMKPGLPDLATREGQEKLRVLKYLTGKR